MGQPNLDAFQIIADHNRREILHLLTSESLSINAIAEKFDISRPAISKHIKILESAGFLTIEDKGRERFCMLNPQGFYELREWIDYYDNFWMQKLGALETLMNQNNFFEGFDQDLK